MKCDIFVSYGTRSGPQWGSQSDAVSRFNAHKSFMPIEYAGVSGDSTRLVGWYQGQGQSVAETCRIKLTQNGMDGVSLLETFLLGRVQNAELVGELMGRAGLKRSVVEQTASRA